MSESPLIRFADVVGHERAIDFLRQGVRHERLAHSLLLAGPDGIGKRSLAFAFAAWIHCAARGDDACGECSSCRQIAAASHPDVRIVAIPSGKKEIGVDHARDLKRWIGLRSAAESVKTAILLDADMLTVAAQNALLKTLEEPPADAILLIVTNNADALLPTVRSRCQRVPLRPLANQLVEDLLVARHAMPRDLAARLASLAEGSPGRALGLKAALGDPTTADLAIDLATLSSARYVRLAQMASTLNSPEAGAAAKLDFLVRQYRDAALSSVAAAESPASVSAAVRNADTIHTALAAMRRTNPNRQLLLEALLLQLASNSRSTSKAN